jgi:opacity protein-like surface antigen
MKIIILSLMSLTLFANSSVNLESYYESFTVSNSKQKRDGYRVGMGADYRFENIAIKALYEHGQTHTFQPPLKEDLFVDKVYVKGEYAFNADFKAHLHYINVLKDTIVPTAYSVSYGAGLSYAANKKLSISVTQFYTDYQIFDAYQSDLKLDLKMRFDDLKIKLSSLTKVIHLQGYENAVFSKNAQEDYLTSGLKLHAHYQAYHFGAGVYYGKRAFAVMNDGFKLQHHAMEFDRTYAVGFGRSFSDLILRFQYVYQRATELPFENDNVTFDNFRFIGNYRF